MKLTDEQKKSRIEMTNISKKLAKETGKDRIKFNKGAIDNYHSFVIFDDTTICEGGWYYGRKWMTAKYLNALVDKWVKRSYETGREQPDYDVGNQWIPHQCGGCHWFAAIDADYGFCCNFKSPNEGRITFEHGGCKEHSDYVEG